MTERTAMHEISHTLGIGQTAAFNTKCAANDWATATPLLRSWDGSSAKINCGGGHIWPYGLNVSFFFFFFFFFNTFFLYPFHLPF